MSRHGLHSQGGVAPTRWCSIDECSIYMHAVQNGQLLTFCCPRTSSDSSPAICRIRFSKASLRYRLLSFCYVTDDTESRNPSDSAVQSTKVLREPIQTTENKGEFRVLCGEISTMCLCPLPSAVAVPLQNTKILQLPHLHHGLATASPSPLNLSQARREKQEVKRTLKESVRFVY